MIARLSAVSLGIAFGVTKGLWMLAFAWMAWHWGLGITLLHNVADVYYGYEASFYGGLWGALWGFIEGFVFGLILGWVYNIGVRCLRKEEED